jgi:hypothetical protein
MDNDFEQPLEEIGDKYVHPHELLGKPFSEPDPCKDDSSYLFVAAETDGFSDAVVALLIGALRNRKSVNCRESACWLCQCAELPSLTPHVIRAMKLEHRCRKRSEYGLYVNYFLADFVAEKMLRPMLAIWKNPATDSYSKSVARDFLQRFLAKPLA